MPSLDDLETLVTLARNVCRAFDADAISEHDLTDEALDALEALRDQLDALAPEVA